MPITRRNEQIIEWERLAADCFNRPLEAIKAVHERLAAHGPTERGTIMARKVIRKLLKFNDFPIAKQFGVRPVAIREAAKSLKVTLEAAIQLRDAQQLEGAESVETPPIELLKDGVHTTFANGQTWTLRGGRPERVEAAHG